MTLQSYSVPFHRLNIAHSEDHYQQARELVLQYAHNATAYQALNPGVQRWLSARGDAVVGYVGAAGYRVVAGSPSCAPGQLAETVREFEADARRSGQRVCYLNADARLLAAATALRPAPHLLLGAEPIWRPDRWLATVAGKSSLRGQVARARNKGVQVSAWPVGRANSEPALRRVLAAWLQTGILPPLRFPFPANVLAHLADRKLFVAEQDDQIVGFLTASPVAARNGWLVEQTVRGIDAPNGTAELMLHTAVQHFQQAGATYVTLGLSPLSTRAEFVQPAPTSTLLSKPVARLFAWMQAHGRQRFGFEGMDAFKAKFQPKRWEPIYLTTNERRLSLRALYAVVAACSGRTPLRFTERAIARSIRQRLRQPG